MPLTDLGKQRDEKVVKASVSTTYWLAEKHSMCNAFLLVVSVMVVLTSEVRSLYKIYHIYDELGEFTK